MYQEEVSVLDLRAVTGDLAHRAEHAQFDTRLGQFDRLCSKRARACNRLQLRVALLEHRHILVEHTSWSHVSKKLAETNSGLRFPRCAR